jgi:hypothetical protein
MRSASELDAQARQNWEKNFQIADGAYEGWVCPAPGFSHQTTG